MEVTAALFYPHIDHDTVEERRSACHSVIPSV